MTVNQKCVYVVFNWCVEFVTACCARTALAKHHPPSGYTDRHNWWHPQQGVGWWADKYAIMGNPTPMHSIFLTLSKCTKLNINLAFKWTYVMELEHNWTRLKHFIISTLSRRGWREGSWQNLFFVHFFYNDHTFLTDLFLIIETCPEWYLRITASSPTPYIAGTVRWFNHMTLSLLKIKFKLLNLASKHFAHTGIGLSSI